MHVAIGVLVTLAGVGASYYIDKKALPPKVPEAVNIPVKSTDHTAIKYAAALVAGIALAKVIK